MNEPWYRDKRTGQILWGDGPPPETTTLSLTLSEWRRLRNGFLMGFGRTADEPNPDDLAVRNKLDRAIARLEARADEYASE